MDLLGKEYFNISPDLIYISDLAGNPIDTNPAWESVLGWSREELFKTPIIEFVYPDDRAATLAELDSFIADKNHKTIDFENRYIHKAGGHRWVQWRAIFLKSNNQILCVGRDITISKREILFLNEMQQVSKIGSWEIDLTTNEVFWSKMIHQILETDPDNSRMLFGDGLRFVDLDSREILKSELKRIMANGGGCDLELPATTLKGKKIWLRCTAQASLRDGVVNRVYGTLEDVTAKRMEKSRYEVIVESGNFGAWDYDLETDIVYFNERCCEMLGLDYKTNKQHFVSDWNLTHPEDQKMLRQALDNCLEGKTPFFRAVVRMRHTDGHWVWILDQGKVIEYRDGKPVRITGTHTDISYIKELESEKIALNERFKLVLDAIDFGVWEFNVPDNFVTWDDSTYRLFEVSREEFPDPRIAWETFIHPDDREMCRTTFLNGIATGTGIDLIYRIRLKSGEIRHIAHKGYVEKDLYGKAFRVTGINWDITREVEQTRIFETIINNIPIMITYYNDKGDVEWINSEWTDVLGWKLEDIKRVDDLAKNLFPDEEVQAAATQFMQEAPPEWREFTVLKKNGEFTHTIWTNVKLADGKMIGIGQSIEEKIKQEELIKDQQARMISSAKLSSLGEMASGIAHEINNPLAIIKGKAYQILKKLEAGEVNTDFLIKEVSRIEQNSLRIVKIIKGLRTFSRQGEGDPFQLVTFKSVLEDVLELCNERFKHQGVALKFSGDLDVQIYVQETQMAQVLLNLINNAFDAVVDTEEPWVEVSVIQNDEFTKIFVTDSGKGISSDVAQKIMQPFFTTKDVGTGTGLGLSISKGIVEMHNGRLYLDQNYPNTRFVIEIPTYNLLKT